jgi:tetratricopeptide (TPR) repeat protein
MKNMDVTGGDLRRLNIIVQTPALESLSRHLGLACREYPVRLLLEGERGVGKRTAIEYALKRHQAKGELIVLRGSADQFRSPLSPLAEAFSCLLEGNAHNDHILRPASRVASELAELVPFFNTLGGRVKELFQGYPPQTGTYPILETADLLFRLRKLLNVLAFEFHPVLIFTDIHQYDHSTLSILGKLAGREDSESSFVFTYDPYSVEHASQEQFHAFESTLTSHLLFKKVKFNRFSSQQTEEFINALLGVGAATMEQAASLHKRTGGTPLFLRELLAHLEEEGHIARDENGRKLLNSYLAATLPDSISDLITIKLQQLPDELRTIIDLASVIGTEFQSEPISEGLQLSHLLVLNRLRKLEMGYSLVEQMASSHRFSLEAIREAVYESLGPALAREHHLLLARYFEHHTNSPDVDYLLYYHYRRAHFPEKSIKYLIESAYSARRRFSYEEAAHRFHLAQDLTAQLRGSKDRQSTRLGLEEGIAYFEGGAFALSAERLTALAPDDFDRESRAIRLFYLSLSEYMSDDPAAARLTLDSLFSNGLSALPADLRLRAIMSKAAILYAVGSWDEARMTYLRFIREVPPGVETLRADAVKRINMFYLPELALPLLRKTQERIEINRHLPLYWEVHHNIGANYLLLGELELSESYFREALDEFYKMGTYRVSYTLNNLGLIKMFQGNFDEARDLFNQVRAISRVDYDRMSAGCHLAIIDCLSGTPEKAIPQLEAIWCRARGMSEILLTELICHNLAWAYSLAGDYSKALNRLQEGPGVRKDLWSDFRSERRQRMMAYLSQGLPAANRTTELTTATGRRSARSFKCFEYDANDLWFWE